MSGKELRTPRAKGGPSARNPGSGGGIPPDGREDQAWHMSIPAQRAFPVADIECALDTPEPIGLEVPLGGRF